MDSDVRWLLDAADRYDRRGLPVTAMLFRQEAYILRQAEIAPQTGSNSAVEGNSTHVQVK